MQPAGARQLRHPCDHRRSSRRRVWHAAVVPPDAIIRWVEEDRRDRDSLARWQHHRAGAASAARQSAAVPVSDRLAVATWNVHVGSGNVADVVRRLRSGEFTGGEPIEQFVPLPRRYRRDTAVRADPRGFPRLTVLPRVGRGPDIGHRKGPGRRAFLLPAMRNGIASVDPDRGRDSVDARPARSGRRRAADGEPAPPAVLATVQAQARDGLPWTLRVANVHLDTSLAITRADRSRRAGARPTRSSMRSAPGRMSPRSGRRFQYLVGAHRAGGEHPAQRLPQTPAPEPGHLARSARPPRAARLRFCAALAPAKVQRLRAGRIGSLPALAIVTLTPPPQDAPRPVTQ